MQHKINKSISVSTSSRITVKANTRTNIELSGNGSYTFIVERNGLLYVADIIKSEGSVKQNILIELSGHGAQAYVSSGFHGFKKAQHSMDIVMHHKARNTKGDILIRAVYEGKARGSFSGLIKIDPKAQQSDSYFTDNVLLMDDGMATSVPTLEIEADDVHASHGSTTNNLDENQLFYLQSRGISKRAARQMISKGFFQLIYDRISSL